MPFMQPKQDNLSRLRARQGSVKSACEGAKYIKMGWLNWEAAFVLSHPFSCLEHGCENGWSYRNQENGSHLACNPSEADMKTRMWVQVIGAVIQGSTGRWAGRKTGKGEKLIKDELLLWILGAQCSWELHCRIHFRVICPPPFPGARGLEYLFTIAWEILLEVGGMSLTPWYLWLAPWTGEQAPMAIKRCFILCKPLFSFLLHAAKPASHWTTPTHPMHLWLTFLIAEQHSIGGCTIISWRNQLFPVFTVISKAAMNIFVDKSLHAFLLIFLSKIHRGIIIWWKAMNILKAFYTITLLLGGVFLCWSRWKENNPFPQVNDT